MRTQRQLRPTGTISRPRIGAAPLTETVHGLQFDADVPGQDAGAHELLVRQTGVWNIPGCYEFAPNDRLIVCGTEWEIVGKASHWLDRTKVRVQEAGPLLHCTIRHPGATKGAFDETTGTFPSVPLEPYYTGIVRAQQATTESRALVVAEDDITTLAYLVALPDNVAELTVGDVVTVAKLDDAGGPTSPGIDLYVKAFSQTSLVWTRDLICTDHI